MPSFFEYLRNITYYLMFATVAGMFAPVGNYRKFVSLVLGFILLLLMIQPLARFFQAREVPVTQWFIGGFSETNEESDYMYFDGHNEYLRGAFEEQLNLQLSRLLSENGYTVDSSAFEYSDDFGKITSVRVSVSQSETQESDYVPFIRIIPPRISPIRIGSQPAENNPEEEAIKTLISEFYNLSSAHIHVIIN